MNYLKDTCVFINKIQYPSTVFNLAKYCNDKNDVLSITNTVLEELQYEGKLDENKKEISRGIVNMINLCKQNELVEIIDFQRYKKDYEAIRKNYYGFATNPQYLNMLVQSGKMTREEVKVLKYKDRGECSCLAIAKQDPLNYVIVTEDKGKITGMPSINLFNEFKNKFGIQIFKYDEWVKKIKYCDNEEKIN